VHAEWISLDFAGLFGLLEAISIKVFASSAVIKPYKAQGLESRGRWRYT
jgi:hypothetical protein